MSFFRSQFWKSKFWASRFWGRTTDVPPPVPELDPDISIGHPINEIKFQHVISQIRDLNVSINEIKLSTNLSNNEFNLFHTINVIELNTPIEIDQLSINHVINMHELTAELSKDFTFEHAINAITRSQQINSLHDVNHSINEIKLDWTLLH